MAFGRRPRNPNPSWVNWVVIAVLGIALLTKFSGHTPPEAPPTPQLDALKEKMQDGELVETVKSKINISDRDLLRTEALTEGTGPTAVCGQQVKIAHEVSTEDQSIEQSSKEKPLSYRIGMKEVIPALDLGVIGMRAGGTYKITASPDLAYSNDTFKREGVPPGENVTINVELLDVQPALPNLAENAFRIIDMKPGSGEPILCADTAKLYLTMWGTDGKKLFSNKGQPDKIIQLSVGKSTVFMGLELGTISMRPEGSRFLIVPPALQKTLTGGPSAIDFPFPKDQTVLVEIESVP